MTTYKRHRKNTRVVRYAYPISYGLKILVERDLKTRDRE